MKHYISKEFQVEVAHRIHNQVDLHNQKGKCQNIHGHSVKIKVTLVSETLNEIGMIMDYTHINHLLKEYLDKYFDHHLIVAAGDDKLIDFLLPKVKEEIRNIRIVDYIIGEITVLPIESTTSELLSKYLYEEFTNTLKDNNLHNIKVFSVSYKETESSEAVYQSNILML